MRMTNKEVVEQLKWVQKRICNITYSPESFEAIEVAIKALEDRQQGEWTNLSPFDENGLCSVCGGCYPSYYRFCPLCGADMRKEEKE